MSLSIPKIKSDEVICPICIEPLSDPRALPCAHVFDHACVERWIRSNNSCPICRTPVNQIDLVQPIRPPRNLAVANIEEGPDIFADMRDLVQASEEYEQISQIYEGLLVDDRIEGGLNRFRFRIQHNPARVVEPQSRGLLWKAVAVLAISIFVYQLSSYMGGASAFREYQK